MDKNKEYAGCALTIIIGIVILWLITEMATSTALPIISTLVFIGVVIYYLFFRSK